MVDEVIPSIGAVQNPKVKACLEFLRSSKGTSVAGENKGGQEWWEMTSVR